ncbi:hypothetical protein [Salinactinospora qingdaonensis]|uniref:hypothetical protein n=1 Tax=Salinactinospora qingdaonensis TaxID=702744 RepID=UPI0031ECCBCD
MPPSQARSTRRTSEFGYGCTCCLLFLVIGLVFFAAAGYILLFHSVEVGRLLGELFGRG